MPALTIISTLSTENMPNFKRTHVYYDQLQGQMGITGADWCDFVVYTKAGLEY